MNPKTILRTAERRGLNAIAVTDHNTIRGGVKTLRISEEEKSKVMVIVGAEISTGIGDLIGLFLNEEIKSRNTLEVVDEIQAQDGLLLVPHPFRGRKFGGFQVIISRINLLEIMNSHSPITLEQIHFLKTFNKTLVGGSDAHFPQEIGLCKTILDSSILDIDEIKKKLLLPSNAIAYGSYGSPLFRMLSQMVRFIKSKPF